MTRKSNSVKTLPRHFQKAYDNLPAIKQPEFRQKLKEILNITTDVQAYNYIKGAIEPKGAKLFEIEDLFKSYGINSSLTVRNMV